MRLVSLAGWPLFSGASKIATIEHSTLTDPELHEPKGAASATAGQVYVADGAGSGDWTDQVIADYLCLDIADGSAETSYYLVVPNAGTISKITTVIDDVVSTADITITASIAGIAVTAGVITIAQSGSAAGTVDSCSPAALNIVAADDVIKFLVTGGGAGGAPRIHLLCEITRA